MGAGAVMDFDPTTATLVGFDPATAKQDSAFDPSTAVLSQATPANFADVKAGATSAAAPIPIGVGEMVVRGLANTGARSLAALGRLAEVTNPGMMLERAGREAAQQDFDQQASDALKLAPTPEPSADPYSAWMAKTAARKQAATAAANLTQAGQDVYNSDPLQSLVASAQEAARLKSGEVPASTAADVAGKVAEGGSSLATAMAVGPGGLVPDAATAALRAVPFLGKVLKGAADASGVATTLTGLQSAPHEDISDYEKAKEIAGSEAFNVALGGVPQFFGKSLPVRIGSGLAGGGALSAGTAALEGRPQNTAENVTGALMGGMFGLRGNGESVDPTETAYDKAVRIAAEKARAGLDPDTGLPTPPPATATGLLPVSPEIRADTIAAHKAAETPPHVAAAAAAGDPIAQGTQAAGDIIAEAKAGAAVTQPVPDLAPPAASVAPEAPAPAPAPTPQELKFTQAGDGVGREYHETLFAYFNGPDGPVEAGRLSVAHHGGDEASVLNVEVPPEFRRLGYARALYQEFARQYPATTLGTLGVRTADGTAMRGALEADGTIKGAPQAVEAPSPPPVTAEPFSNGTRVLFRGDVDQIKQQLSAAGLPEGMVKREGGNPIGVYYPSSYAGEAAKVLGVESPVQPTGDNVPHETSGYAQSIEPIGNGSKVLFRGDVDAMRQRLTDAGIDPGYAMVEDGAKVGVYFPKAVADKVAAVLKAPEPVADVPSVAGIPSSQPDMVLAARNLHENGGGRVNNTDWHIGTDGVVSVAHAVTGREYGTVDLNTGELTPYKPGDEPHLRAVVDTISQYAEKSAARSELGNLRDYPVKNKSRIDALEKAYPELAKPTDVPNVQTGATKGQTPAPNADFKRTWLPSDRNDSKGRPILVPALDYSRDSLIHWLGRNGGVDFNQLHAQNQTDPALLSDPSVMRPFGRVGFPALRRNGGMSIDHLRERMEQDGWLPPNSYDTDAAALAHEAINGREVVHPYEGADERTLRAYQDAQDTPSNGLDLHDVHPAEATNTDAVVAHIADRHDAASAEVGHSFDNASASDALSIVDLTHRAIAAGADPIDVSFAHGQTPVDTARNLWAIVKAHEGDYAEPAGHEETNRGGDRGAAQADRAADEPGQAGRAAGQAQAGLFAEPTTAERIRAQSEAADVARNGLGRDLVRPEQGPGDLLAGPRPEQTSIPDAGKPAQEPPKAAPSEGPKPVSTKEASMQAARVARGEEALPKVPMPAHEQEVADARQRMADNPHLADGIVARKLGGDHTISAADEAVLQAHAVDLTNQMEAQAKHASDPNAGQAERDLARQRGDELAQRFNDLNQATKITGAAWSHFGRQRMQELLNDYSFAALVRKETTRQQRPLTADETATLKTQADRISQLEKEAETHAQALKDALAEKAKPSGPKKSLDERAQARLRIDIANLEQQIRQRLSACPV
jgi:hypothetical protein